MSQDARIGPRGPRPRPTPTRFYKSTIRWNGNGWDLRLTGGTVYVFGNEAPLQAIRDRYGNQVTIAHANGQSGNVTQVTSPNGRWIQFAYTNGRVSGVTDNIGRTVSYTYDANGNLSTVTDPENNVTTYTYTAGNQMATIKDGRNFVYLTNEYTNGRVTRQTLADPNATYTFAYTLDASTPPNVTQTDITDPRGHVERLSFNSDHYLVTDVEAVGTDRQRTTTYERPTHNNFVGAIVDGLNRRTEYTYDSAGHILTVKRLANTPDWVQTTYTYEPQFNQLATITDPLTHTWTIGYDALGKIANVTDPLTHHTVLSTNPQGRVTGLTDALQHTWTWGYTAGDLVATSNPVGSSTQRFLDGAGRVLTMVDALGRKTRMAVDKLNRITSVIDPAGGQTQLAYDPNSNLTTLTDALTHGTTYTYDASDRVAIRTDPLQRSAAFFYDAKGLQIRTVDRRGQITQYQYDELDRLTQTTFGDGATAQYTYDLGDRVTQTVDSVSGTITRSYDGLDRLTAETTPEGSIAYTYDKDGRRATMTVAGQPQVGYAYDDGHRLLSITQGSSVVSFTYDDANRRSTQTLPNGIVTTYGYDNANQLTELTYTLGATPLGNLTYTYDTGGGRVAVGGTWARTGLPRALGSATFDAANRMQAWDQQLMSYDLNGNLTSDGLTSYSWNARNQLTGLTGGTSASFAYDGTGRRRSKTISGTTTTFLWDEFNLVQELDGGGTPTANLPMASAVDEILLRMDGAGASTLLMDGIGSTLALADAAGTVQTQYTYEPFGATTTSRAASTNAAQFTGRENDGTGLYYYRARYYSPGSDRFIAEDPLYQAQLVLPPGEGLYTYVRNSPTAFIDPSGETTIPFPIPFPWIPEIGIGAGIGVGAGVGAAVGGIWCATSPACRQYVKCLWQLTRDVAKCVGKGLCPGTNPEDTDACLKRAYDDFWRCTGDTPPKYPRNPDGTLPFPKR
jgi:RHS repeat-associated protein